jgi:hypothetical protein
MPHKFNADRRDKIPKQKRRVAFCLFDPCTQRPLFGLVAGGRHQCLMGALVRQFRSKRSHNPA